MNRNTQTEKTETVTQKMLQKSILKCFVVFSGKHLCRCFNNTTSYFANYQNSFYRTHVNCCFCAAKVNKFFRSCLLVCIPPLKVIQPVGLRVTNNLVFRRLLLTPVQFMSYWRFNRQSIFCPFNASYRCLF